MDGLLILDKPKGLTSQQALSRVRRALKVKKLGHTGTLDPLATGVLPIAFGEATKIISYLAENTKAYRVTGRLGETTDSYDSDGEIVKRADATGVDRDNLESTLKKFLGAQEQVPPVYSAIKVQGRKLYEYARSGEGVELKPRQVHFAALELESFVSPDFILRIDCSKGTYVRSLVHDIGESLGCGAHVTELRRLASGAFDLSHALNLEQILADPSRVEANLLSIEALLQDWPRVELEPGEVARVRSGVPLHRVQQCLEAKDLLNRRLLLVHDSTVHALIESPAGRAFEYLRVLNRQSASATIPNLKQPIENT